MEFRTYICLVFCNYLCLEVNKLNSGGTFLGQKNLITMTAICTNLIHPVSRSCLILSSFTRINIMWLIHMEEWRGEKSCLGIFLVNFLVIQSQFFFMICYVPPLLYVNHTLWLLSQVMQLSDFFINANDQPYLLFRLPSSDWSQLLNQISN
jgi:hypothetical protein